MGTDFKNSMYTLSKSEKSWRVQRITIKEDTAAGVLKNNTHVILSTDES